MLCRACAVFRSAFFVRFRRASRTSVLTNGTWRVSPFVGLGCLSVKLFSFCSVKPLRNLSFASPRKTLFRQRSLHHHQVPLQTPRSGELRTQKLKSHLLRTQSLKIPPLKPGVGQYLAIRATLTASEFFLAYVYPSGPFTCIFQTSPNFFLCWLWLTPVPVLALRIK